MKDAGFFFLILLLRRVLLQILTLKRLHHEQLMMGIYLWNLFQPCLRLTCIDMAYFEASSSVAKVEKIRDRKSCINHKI